MKIFPHRYAQEDEDPDSIMNESITESIHQCIAREYLYMVIERPRHGLLPKVSATIKRKNLPIETSPIIMDGNNVGQAYRILKSNQHLLEDKYGVGMRSLSVKDQADMFFSDPNGSILGNDAVLLKIATLDWKPV